MEDTFCCPITLEQFTEPIVIPECGHTFDKKSLESLHQKKCPLCDIIYSGNPNDFPINWIVVSHLNLEIHKKINEDKLTNYDAIEALNDKRNYITENTDRYMRAILVNINLLAKKGKSEYEFYTSIVDPILLPYIYEELVKREFKISTMGCYTSIKWE
jgi:hypothetical protein